MAGLLEAMASIVEDLAQRPEFPFEHSIPEDQAKEAEAFWVDLLGGWEE